MFKDNVVSFEDARIVNVIEHFKATGKLKFGQADLQNVEKMVETFSNWNLKTNGEYAETFAKMHSALMDYAKFLMDAHVSSMMVIKYKLAALDKRYTECFEPLYNYTLNSAVIPSGKNMLGDPEIISFVSVLMNMMTTNDFQISDENKEILIHEFKQHYDEIHGVYSTVIDSLKNFDYTVPNEDSLDEPSRNYIGRMKEKNQAQIAVLEKFKDFIEKFIGDV